MATDDLQQVQLAEWNGYTLRPPCMVFKNPKKTKAYMRALLLRNGFDSVGIPPISSRQFRFRAFKNGTQVVGIVTVRESLHAFRHEEHRLRHCRRSGCDARGDFGIVGSDLVRGDDRAVAASRSLVAPPHLPGTRCGA